MVSIKIKHTNEDGITRTEAKADIKEVLVNEDLLHPENESIALCFRGKKSSGIIEMSPAEFEKIHEFVKDKMHLIKGFRKVYSGGAFRL